MMITATELRTLDVSPEGSDTQPSYISAASGMVCVGSHIYVIADDELHLGVFSAGNNDPGHLIRLFAGELPITKADRKRQKPDLEAIVFIPAFEGFSDGALLALGSASRPNRGRGVLLRLDPQGAISGSPELVDMAPLLGPLQQAFVDLNIEGAAVVGGEKLPPASFRKRTKGISLIFYFQIVRRQNIYGASVEQLVKGSGKKACYILAILKPIRRIRVHPPEVLLPSEVATLPRPTKAGRRGKK